MTRLSHEELDTSLAQQRAEIVSDDNRWYAGEYFGHSPTPEECAEYYCFLCRQGGAQAHGARRTVRLNQT